VGRPGFHPEAHSIHVIRGRAIELYTAGMSRSIHLMPHLSAHELGIQCRRTQDQVERSHWRFLWLLARGFTATAIARVTGYSAYWLGQIARRYNARGPDGVTDQRHLARPHRHRLSATHHEELRVALSGPVPQHDRWNGRTVAAWMTQRLGRPICRRLAGSTCGGSALGYADRVLAISTRTRRRRSSCGRSTNIAWS
jgi:hypothetical protein